MDKENICIPRRPFPGSRISLLSGIKMQNLNHSEIIPKTSRVGVREKKTFSTYSVGEGSIRDSVKSFDSSFETDQTLKPLADNLIEKEKLKIKIEKLRENDIKLLNIKKEEKKSNFAN